MRIVWARNVDTEVFIAQAAIAKDTAVLACGGFTLAVSAAKQSQHCAQSLDMSVN